MKNQIKKGSFLLLFFITLAFSGFGQSAIPITIEPDHTVAQIQPTMWGLFFEDINFAADGGLYAEMIKNRSFEFPDPLEGWIVEGANLFHSPLPVVNNSSKSQENPRIARIQVNDSACLVNKDFRGDARPLFIDRH